MENKKNIIKSTEDGRLYIETSDFFKQKEVKNLIEKLMDSSIYREIVEQKEKESSSDLTTV